MIGPSERLEILQRLGLVSQSHNLVIPFVKNFDLNLLGLLVSVNDSELFDFVQVVSEDFEGRVVSDLRVNFRIAFDDRLNVIFVNF